LEFLRRGAELTYEGFRTHLNGYEARALVDFQRVHEKEGRWAEVADQLQGGGTASVRRHLRRLELAPELAMIRTWVSAAVLSDLECRVAGAAEADDLPAKPPLEAAAQPAVPVDLPTVLTAAIAGLERLATYPVPSALGPRSQAEVKALLAALPGSRIPQALYLREVFKLVPGDWAPSVPTAAQWAAADGTSCDLSALRTADLPLVRAEMRTALVAWTGHEFAGNSTVGLAELLLRSEAWLQEMAAGRVAWFSELLGLPGAWTSLGVNRHESHTYLNREALEIYLQAMVAGGMVADGLLAAGSDVLGHLLDAQALLLEAAARCGYEIEALRADLNGGVGL
jgi:hypothetical protein